MWCSEPQVNWRDQPIFVSDTVSSAPKSSIICFLSKKSDFFGNGSLIFEDMISVLDLLYPVNYIIKVRF